MHQQKPRILIIGINFFPEPTGIGKYTGELAFSLADRGFTVDVITAYPYYPQWKVYKGYKSVWFKFEKIKGVNITRCPFYVPASLSGKKRMVQDFSFFLSSLVGVFRKISKRKDYALVFVSSPSFMSGFLGLVYRTFYKKAKFVYHIQDLQIDAAEELSMIKSGFTLNFLKWIEGSILRHSDWVTTISSGMMAKIKAKPYPIKQTYLFPNWVDFNNIYKKEPDMQVIAGLGFPTDKKLCLYSGAVGEKQGLEFILQIAKSAQDELAGLVFVIAGSGPYVSVLKEQATAMQLTNLYFINLQPITVFNELLNYAFVHFVIQKEKAGDLLLPSKLTNILAVGGLAVITASSETSLYKIVAGNELGIVVPPDDAEAFWQVLRNLYQEPEKVRTLKDNASKYALKFLDKNAVIDSFLKEIEMQ
jgi:colanic acid biosynthesis glycosyl transferase WcaI